MKFQFEITPDYLINHNGTEVIRAKVSYEIRLSVGIDNVEVKIPIDVLPRISNNALLATDILASVHIHAEALIEEDKEFLKNIPQ